MALVNQVNDVTTDQLLKREDLFISRHEIEVQVHPIPILTHACLRSLSIIKQCDSCYVLSLKLLNCCGYLFISGHGNKVRVHPIPFSTHLSCLLKVFFRIESSVIHDSKVSVLEPADEMTR